MSFWKRKTKASPEARETEIVQAEAREASDPVIRALAPLGTTTPLAPADMLGKKIVKVGTFDGLVPVKLDEEELDRKTDLKYVPVNTWVWIDQSDIYGHDDGCAVVLCDKTAYLSLPRHIADFDRYLRVLKLAAGNTFVLACERQFALAAIRGMKTHNWSSSLIRGEAYPVVELTDEMKAGAPEA